MMYTRQGSLSSQTDNEIPVLTDSHGKSFQVTILAAFIWKRLDGDTSLAEIKEQLSSIEEVDSNELDSVVDFIVKELVRTNLVSA